MVQNHSSKTTPRILSAAAAIAALFILTIMLWAPTGLDVGFWGDDWIETSVADAGSGIRWQTARPMVPLSILIGRVISPDGFSGFNLVLIVTFTLKATFIYLLLLQITRNGLFAFAAAILSLLSPADTAVFNMITVNIQIALTALIAGCYFLVLSWEYGRGWWLPMWAALGLAVMIYEAVYPVILFGPLLLIWQAGRPNRRMFAYAAAWYAPALMMLAYIALLIIGNPQSLSYQSRLAAAPVSINDMISAFWSFVRRLFGYGWWNVAVPLNDAFRWYERAAAIIVLGVAAISAYSSPKRAERRYLILVVVGALLVGLTSLVYLPTSLRLTFDRTLMFSGVGAAIFAAAFFWWLLARFRWGWVIYAALLAVFAMIGMNGLINQHRRYQDNSLAQQAVLGRLVTVTGTAAPDSVVILWDQTQSVALRRVFLNYILYADRAWQVIQSSNSTNLILCYPNDQEGWGTFNEHCEFDSDGVSIWNDSNQLRHFSADRLVVLTYTEDASVQLAPLDSLPFADAGYNPTALIQPEVLPLRAQTMLGMQLTGE